MREAGRTDQKHKETGAQTMTLAKKDVVPAVDVVEEEETSGSREGRVVAAVDGEEKEEAAIVLGEVDTEAQTGLRM
jgi:hypothetical protein